MTYRPPKRIEELKATALRILINKLYHPAEGLEELVLESALEEALLHVKEMERQVAAAEHDVIYAKSETATKLLEGRAIDRRRFLHLAQVKAQRLVEAFEPFRLLREIRSANDKLGGLYKTANVFEFLFAADAIYPEQLAEAVADQAERRQQITVLHQEIDELTSRLQQLPRGNELLQSLDPNIAKGSE